MTTSTSAATNLSYLQRTSFLANDRLHHGGTGPSRTTKPPNHQQGNHSLLGSRHTSAQPIASAIVATGCKSNEHRCRFTKQLSIDQIATDLSIVVHRRRQFAHMYGKAARNYMIYVSPKHASAYSTAVSTSTPSTDAAACQKYQQAQRHLSQTTRRLASSLAIGLMCQENSSRRLKSSVQQPSTR